MLAAPEYRSIPNALGRWMAPQHGTSIGLHVSWAGRGRCFPAGAPERFRVKREPACARDARENKRRGCLCVSVKTEAAPPPVTHSWAKVRHARTRPGGRARAMDASGARVPACVSRMVWCPRRDSNTRHQVSSHLGFRRRRAIGTGVRGLDYPFAMARTCKALGAARLVSTPSFAEPARGRAGRLGSGLAWPEATFRAEAFPDFERIHTGRFRHGCPIF